MNRAGLYIQLNILSEVSSNAYRNLTIDSIYIQVFSKSLVALTDYNNHNLCGLNQFFSCLSAFMGKTNVSAGMFSLLLYVIVMRI